MRSLLAAMALLVCCALPAGAQQNERPADPRPPPAFPPGLVGTGAVGTTVLVITHDGAGKVLDVVVEKSSGYEEFNEAAIQAARNWTMPKPVDGGSVGRARVPVDFKQPPPGYFGVESDTLTPAQQRAWHASWQQMQVAAATADADGNLPAYLPDDFPLPATSARELMAWLKAHATPVDAMDDGVSRYQWKDGPAVHNFEVFDQGWASPTVIRHRLVSDGTQMFWKQRYVCDAAEPSACERFEAMIREMPPQPSLGPPPPTPPAAPAGD